MDAHLSGDMQRALARIPERQRAALLLAELHDLTGVELAAALGVSHVAARALLTRARESLRQALAAERAAEAEAEANASAAPHSRERSPMSRMQRLRPTTASGAPRARPRPGRPAHGCERSSRPTPRGSTSISPAATRAARSPPHTRPTAWPCARLRDRQPEPPRDLWARTAAAIERESSAPRRAARARPARGDRGPPSASCPGVAVIAVVIGATVLSGGFIQAPADRDRRPVRRARRWPSPRPRRRPDATPIAVGAGSVGWVGIVGRRRARLQRRQGQRGLSDGAPAAIAPRSRTATPGTSTSRSGRSRSRKSPVNAAGGRRRQGRRGRRRGRTSIALPTADPDRDADRDAHPDSDAGTDARHRRRRRASNPRRPAAASRPVGHAAATPNETPTPDGRADARAHTAADAGRHPDTDPGHPDEPRHRVRRQGRRPVGRLLAGRCLVRLHRPPVERLRRPGHLRLAGRR